MNSEFFNNYKPKDLDDINLDEKSKTILNLYLKNKKMLFLIYGENLSGKTSLINILLHSYYNTKNYEKYIIYINLLKEQGINYFRNEIKNFCQINNSNINNIKKSIIIDDFDLLNEFNQKILINYISKYKNINFILSCSDLNKIIESSIHKLELIKIKNIDNIFLEKILNNIIFKTNINIDENIKKKILNDYNKNIPFLVNKILEINLCKISENLILDVNKYIFLDSNILISISKYIDLCRNKNIIEANKLILNLHNDGLSVIDILDNIIYYIKNYNNNLCEKYKFVIIKVVTNYINIFNNLHEDKIELLFLTNNLIRCFN